MLIVSDFDGTICSIPAGYDVPAILSRNEDYLDVAIPNAKVCKILEEAYVIIVTGRTHPLPIWQYCRKHHIHVDRIICSPADIWSRKDGYQVMRARKKMTIECIDPDLVLDDDAKMLAMLDVRRKILIR